MKKIVFLLILIISTFNCFGQQNGITEDEKIQFAMLMNQVQYTTSSIILNKNREILDQEFDFIINQIDKSKLYDSTIKSMYTDLLNTLKELKLNENEKRFIMEQGEREKKQAYTKAFSSFGSIFNAGFSPVSLISSIAYVGVSAGLNIQSARYEVDNKVREQMFKLEQKELEKIDRIRIVLFDAYTDIITSYGIPVEYEISETEMKDLLKKLSEKQDNCKELIQILEGKKNKFKFFPVFWFQLGAQYQIDGNFDKALECYAKFESLKDKYSYLKYDPYYISVAKNKIEILKKQGIEKNNLSILSYLKKIENNLIPENEAENRIFLASNYFELGQNKKAKDLLLLNMARNEYYGISSDMLALIEYEENKNQKELNPALLLELSSLECLLNSANNSAIKISIPEKFGVGKYLYIKYANKVYPYPYEVDTTNLSNIEIDISFDSSKSSDLEINLVSRDDKTIKYTFSIEYIKKNDKALKLLNEINMTFEDIEPCLISKVINKLEEFSYDPKLDQEYLDLVKSHKMRISNQTSKDQKEVFANEEKEKLEELKVKGRLRAITTCVSEATKNLHEFPYFISRLSIDEKGNMLVYSSKNLQYFDEVYSFNKYGVGSKTVVDSSTNDLLISTNKTDLESQYDLSKRYMTGNGVVKNEELSLKYLMLSAINGNSHAQYDLGIIYSDSSSKLYEFFNKTVSLGWGGLINSAINIIADNSTIKNEQIASYWFQKSADGGKGDAVYKMAERYEDGLGVEKNIEKANEYYKQSYYDYGNLNAEKKFK